MWLDIIGIAIFAYFALAGALRGGLASGLSVFTLVAAYAAGALGAIGGGEVAARRFGIPDFLGPPLVGAAFFLVTYFAMGLIAAAWKRRERRRRRRRKLGRRGLIDRFTGACFGTLRGGFVVLLLSLLAIWLEALRTSGAADFLPALGPSRAAAVTRTAVEAGVLAVLDDDRPGERFVARLAARPDATVADLQALLAHPRIAELQRDSLFWTYVENGAIDAALNRASFVAIIHASELREQIAELGLVDAVSGRDPRAFRDAAAAVLREVGPRIRGLRNDPELRKLVDDPEVASLVRSGNTLELLRNQRFRDLVADVAKR